MRFIKLTKGKFTIVDDEDFEYLNQWKWHSIKSHNTFYARRSVTIDKKRVYINMHRMIMHPSERLFVDHINHNGLDNRKENLRIVTTRENHHNRIDQGSFIGVSKHKNRYRSQIRFHKQRIHLGVFDTPELAQQAYFNAVKLYDGLPVH